MSTQSFPTEMPTPTGNLLLAWCQSTRSVANGPAAADAAAAVPVEGTDVAAAAFGPGASLLQVGTAVAAALLGVTVTEALEDNQVGPAASPRTGAAVVPAVSKPVAEIAETDYVAAQAVAGGGDADATAAAADDDGDDDGAVAGAGSAARFSTLAMAATDAHSAETAKVAAAPAVAETVVAAAEHVSGVGADAVVPAIAVAGVHG